ncbi:hypothetical protein OH76DRAFT_1224900 [Lentinus brumalis]|uniref:Uncharacterized protein n=1 Tax=Lentinus brumalis TaxID=2498619 RepID=A0A371DLT1_9APHY|nr:hypothetical protein OH76DRAFT_1224900 [Polyporus brumalis]
MECHRTRRNAATMRVRPNSCLRFLQVSSHMPRVQNALQRDPGCPSGKSPRSAVRFGQVSRLEPRGEMSSDFTVALTSFVTAFPGGDRRCAFLARMDVDADRRIRVKVMRRCPGVRATSEMTTRLGSCGTEQWNVSMTCTLCHVRVCCC